MIYANPPCRCYLLCLLDGLNGVDWDLAVCMCAIIPTFMIGLNINAMSLRTTWIANNNNDNNFVYFMAGRNNKTLIFIGEKSAKCREKVHQDEVERSEREKSHRTVVHSQDAVRCSLVGIRFPNRNDRLKIRFLLLSVESRSVKPC